MRARMGRARRVNGIQTTGDFSYYNRRLIGKRLLRVGDAAGFMDPIFSAGVYLAMYSGKLASRVVIDSLANDGVAEAAMRRYEKKIYRAMQYYWELVEQFYTIPFMELFMEPRHRFHVPDAVVAILAGELDGGWRIEWRRRLFFLLIKLYSIFPLVPHISFAEGKALDRESGGSTRLSEGVTNRSATAKQ